MNSCISMELTRPLFEQDDDGDGLGKFSCCAATADGKIVLVPWNYSAIVIFDPADKSIEEIGTLEGSGKFCSCATTPDGKIVLVPWNYSAIVIFDPADKSIEEIGTLEGSGKFCSCATTPDGKIVLVPWNSPGIAVLSCPSWIVNAWPKPASEKAGRLCRQMWEERSFTDAKVVASSGGQERAIHVHRAVLASRSAFFKTLFEGNFCDSLEAVVHFPEDAAVVESALQHMYTGELGEVDVLQVLPLAHRLGLEDCIVDCAAATHSLEEERLPDALVALSALKGHPAVDLAWSKLMERIHADRGLSFSIMEALAGLACQGLPSTTELQHDTPASAQGGADGQDVSTRTKCQQWSQTKEQETVATQTESASADAGSQEPVTHDGPLPHQYIILHFHRCPALLSRILRSSRLGQELRAQQVDMTPSWANGAMILVPGLSLEDLRQNGHDPASLRPWHVVAMVDDTHEVFSSLQRMPYPQRPRAKARMARRGFLKSAASRKSRTEVSGKTSVIQGEPHGPNSWPEPLRVVPSLVLNVPTMMPDGLQEEEEVPSQGKAAGWHTRFEDSTSEPAAAIDAETADAISKALAASFLEDRDFMPATDSGIATAAMQVQNTFLHDPEGVSGSHSPRTLVTI